MPDIPPTSRILPDGTLRLETPRAFLPVLAPRRFKGLRGGRGGAKSHLVAERFIATCFERRVRAACLREFQSSIKESVKQLLEDKILQFGQSGAFQVTEAEIKGPNDSLFTFKGLHEYVTRAGGPASALKSLEGYTHAWGEEAQAFSQRSIDILTPTFRGRPGDEYPPELWFTWNPMQATDPIERFFNENKDDPDFVCVTTTYADNPWFEASGLRRDMERDKARDYQKYAHIWLGHYLTRSEAQVFQNWRVEEFETPDDARFYLGADWGFANDPTVLIRCFIRGHEILVDYEAYAVGCKIEATPALFVTVPGSKKWRIRADSARPETIDYMRDRNFRVTPALKGKDSVEEGIEFLKSYDIVIHPRCEHTIGEFLTYSWKTDPRTDEVLPQLVDRNNHCIAEGERVTCERGDVPIEEVTTFDRVLTRAGYRQVLFAGCTGCDRETVIVTTTRGSVRCTLDHEVWVEGRGWTRADALRYADDVLLLEPCRCQSGRLASGGMDTSIVNTAMTTIFSARSVAPITTFIGTCGSFTRDLFRRGTRYITGTRTSRTIRSTTLSALRTLSMLCDIPTVTSAARGRLSTSIAYETSLSRGMPVWWEWQSTERLAHWPIRISFPFPSLAINVERHFYRARSAISIASAQMCASRTGDALLAGITRSGSASSVETSSRRISTRVPELVPGRVLTVSPGGRVERVYDLTVEEHHEFFAGGILVSNCIDALRYALEDERSAGRALILSPKALAKFASTPRRDRFGVYSGRNRFARAR